MNTYFENRELKISVFQCLKFYYKAFIASAIMLLNGLCFQKFIFGNDYGFISLFLMVFVSIVIYLLMIFILSREQLLNLKELISF